LTLPYDNPTPAQIAASGDLQGWRNKLSWIEWKIGVLSSSSRNQTPWFSGERSKTIYYYTEEMTRFNRQWSKSRLLQTYQDRMREATKVRIEHSEGITEFDIVTSSGSATNLYSTDSVSRSVYIVNTQMRPHFFRIANPSPSNPASTARFRVGDRMAFYNDAGDWLEIGSLES
jgi:hypothetical protein